MKSLIAFVAVAALSACTTNTSTTVYEARTSSSGTGGGADAATTSTGDGDAGGEGGAGGGLAGVGGSGGSGGAVCVPKTCADVARSCGEMPDGCGKTVHCQDSCGTLGIMHCDDVTNVCACDSLASDPWSANACGHWPAPKAWCVGHTCAPFMCDDQATANIAPTCFYVGNVGLLMGATQSPGGLYCCY